MIAERAAQMDADLFKSAFAAYPTGVTIITARGGDGAVCGITCGSFGPLSLDPPLVAWSLRRQSRHLDNFLHAPTFAVSVLGSGQEEIGRIFASSSGCKFSTGEWLDCATGDPVLAGAVSHFACRTSDRLDRGDHVLFLGEVLEIHYGGGTPVVYCDRAFGVIQRPGQDCAAE